MVDHQHFETWGIGCKVPLPPAPMNADRLSAVVRSLHGKADLSQRTISSLRLKLSARDGRIFELEAEVQSLRRTLKQARKDSIRESMRRNMALSAEDPVLHARLLGTRRNGLDENAADVLDLWDWEESPCGPPERSASGGEEKRVDSLSTRDVPAPPPMKTAAPQSERSDSGRHFKAAVAAPSATITAAADTASEDGFDEGAGPAFVESFGKSG